MLNNPSPLNPKGSQYRQWGVAWELYDRTSHNPPQPAAIEVSQSHEHLMDLKRDIVPPSSPPSPLPFHFLYTTPTPSSPNNPTQHTHSTPTAHPSSPTSIAPGNFRASNNPLDHDSINLYEEALFLLKSAILNDEDRVKILERGGRDVRRYVCECVSRLILWELGGEGGGL